jgi:hypothetical protein
MKKRLTEAQFQECTRDLEVGTQTLTIAHGVLVKGMRQTTFTEQLGLSRGAVSQAVKRIWVAHATNNLPKGFKLVSVVLPEHQAYIVNKWAESAMKKLELS